MVTRRRGVAAAALAALLVGACGGTAPEVPLGTDGAPDATLELGRDVYGRKCSVCHGSEGQGGRGKKLSDGAAEERYPDIADMVAVIAEGKGSGMPSFGDELSEAELTAVARYIREVLG